MNSFAQVLSVADITRALDYAQREQAKAREVTVRAMESQKKWDSEVESLQQLLKIRTEGTGSSEAATGQETPNAPITDDATPHAEGSEVSHIDWIADLVFKSDGRGMTPPEVLMAASQQKRNMHRNYPYTALRNLVEDKRIIKQGSRYFKPGVQSNLALVS